MNKKLFLMKGEYCVEVSYYYGKEIIRQLLDYHVVEEPNDKYELVLWGFGFKFLKNTRGGGDKINMSEYHNLFMVINLWTGYWQNQLERINMRVDE